MFKGMFVFHEIRLCVCVCVFILMSSKSNIGLLGRFLRIFLIINEHELMQSSNISIIVREFFIECQ